MNKFLISLVIVILHSFFGISQKIYYPSIKAEKYLNDIKVIDNKNCILFIYKNTLNNFTINGDKISIVRNFFYQYSKDSIKWENKFHSDTITNNSLSIQKELIQFINLVNNFDSLTNIKKIRISINQNTQFNYSDYLFKGINDSTFYYIPFPLKNFYKIGWDKPVRMLVDSFYLVTNHKNTFSNLVKKGKSGYYRLGKNDFFKVCVKLRNGKFSYKFNSKLFESDNFPFIE